MSDEGGVTRANLQYKEAVKPGLNLEMELKQILASEESEFQKVEVLETHFGKVSTWTMKRDYSIGMLGRLVLSLFCLTNRTNPSALIFPTIDITDTYYRRLYSKFPI